MSSIVQVMGHEGKAWLLDHHCPLLPLGHPHANTKLPEVLGSQRNLATPQLSPLGGALVSMQRVWGSRAQPGAAGCMKLPLEDMGCD